MIDTEAESSAIDPRFIAKCGIPIEKRKIHAKITTADGAIIKGARQQVVHHSIIRIRDPTVHGYRVSKPKFEVFNLYDCASIILGMDWIMENIAVLGMKPLYEDPLRVLEWNMDVKIKKQVHEVRTQAQWDRLVSDNDTVHVALLSAYFEGKKPSRHQLRQLTGRN